MFDRAMLDGRTHGNEPGHHGHLGSGKPPCPRTDLAEVARSCLQTNPYPDVKSLECEYHEGVLMLRGQVSTYYHKQMAQEAVRDIQGIASVVNVVKVVGAAQLYPEDERHTLEEIHDERPPPDVTCIDRPDRRGDPRTYSRDGRIR